MLGLLLQRATNPPSRPCLACWSRLNVQKARKMYCATDLFWQPYDTAKRSGAKRIGDRPPALSKLSEKSINWKRPPAHPMHFEHVALSCRRDETPFLPPASRDACQHIRLCMRSRA